MTTVYFVRHAQPDFNNHEDASRALTPKGLQDRKLVTSFLSKKQVAAVMSSPYKRAVDTVADFAETAGMSVVPIEGFRERRVDSVWIEDFEDFCQRQWADFEYRRSDGETLSEVQRRNIAALQKLLDEYKDKTIVVGGHGTALCTLINYYDSTFGYDEFQKIRELMPWVVEFTFQGEDCKGILQYDLFTGKQTMRRPTGK